MSCPGREASRQQWRQTLVNCGLVALTTALVAAVLLIVSWRSGAPVRTVQSPVLAKALETGRQAADAASAAAWAREMDRLARHAYFGSLRFQRRGMLLLVASLLAALGCFQTAAALDRALPNPRFFAPPGGGRRRLAWYAVAVAVVLAAVMHHLLLLMPRAAAPAGAGPVVALSLRGRPAEESPPPPLADDVLARGWTRFRGPHGLGVSAATRVPLDWDLAAGRNVRWKVPLAQAGFSSPIVWEGRVFLTAADARERAVLAFDLATGAQVWRQTVPYGGGPLPLPAVSDDTGYAAPTMTCDGVRIFALFGTGDLAAFTLAGEPVWRQHLGTAAIDYGHASSPVLAGGLLVIQGDRAENGVVKALDPATGALRWSLARDGIGPSWSTPVVIPPDGELLLHAPYATTLHRLADGRELWRLDAVGGEIAPSPAWDAGRFYVAQEYARVVAYALAGTNAPSQRWEHLEHLPNVASPVAHDGRVWVVTQGGEAVCLDGATGQPLWEHTFEEGFYASPIVGGGCLYLTDRRGNVYILETGRVFKLLATHPLGEPADATPAPGEGYLIFRTSGSLLCVGEAPGEGTRR